MSSPTVPPTFLSTRRRSSAASSVPHVQKFYVHSRCRKCDDGSQNLLPYPTYDDFLASIADPSTPRTYEPAVKITARDPENGSIWSCPKHFSENSRAASKIEAWKATVPDDGSSVASYLNTTVLKFPPGPPRPLDPPMTDKEKENCDAYSDQLYKNTLATLEAFDRPSERRAVCQLDGALTEAPRVDPRVRFAYHELVNQWVTTHATPSALSNVTITAPQVDRDVLKNPDLWGQPFGYLHRGRSTAMTRDQYNDAATASRRRRQSVTLGDNPIFADDTRLVGDFAGMSLTEEPDQTSDVDGSGSDSEAMVSSWGSLVVDPPDRPFSPMNSLVMSPPSLDSSERPDASTASTLIKNRPIGPGRSLSGFKSQNPYKALVEAMLEEQSSQG
ncbi:hypothetical protein IAU59_004711 [Kwoniella sp. CBS 9459]